MGRVEISQVTSAPLDLRQHRDAVDDPAAGAAALFEGTIRNHDPAGTTEVVALEYEAHPSAGAVLAALAHEFANRDGICAVAVSHRVDATLAIGDTAVICAVSSAHRREALDACSELIERIKHEVPIWKRQQFVDGRSDWVNCP